MPLSLDSEIDSAKHSFIVNLHRLLVCSTAIPIGSLKLYHTNEMKSGCNTSKPTLQSRDGHKMDWGSIGLYIGTDLMAVIELANRRKGALLPIGSCLFSAFVPLEQHEISQFVPDISSPPCSSYLRHSVPHHRHCYHHSTHNNRTIVRFVLQKEGAPIQWNSQHGFLRLRSKLRRKTLREIKREKVKVNKIRRIQNCQNKIE